MARLRRDGTRLKARVQALLHTEAYQEVEPLMKTTYERGVEDGIEQGERRAALRQMEAKFGPLSPEVKQRVEALSPEALDQLLLDLLGGNPSRNSAWTIEAQVLRGRRGAGALAFAELDEAQKERVQALLHTEAYQEVGPLMKTTYERGIEDGIERGELRLTLRLMEFKFGPLSSQVKQQVEALSEDARRNSRSICSRRRLSRNSTWTVEGQVDGRRHRARSIV